MFGDNSMKAQLLSLDINIYNYAKSSYTPLNLCVNIYVNFKLNINMNKQSRSLLTNFHSYASILYIII